MVFAFQELLSLTRYTAVPRLDTEGIDEGEAHMIQGVKALLVLCTCPDIALARDLARGLVEDALAACVNVLPEVFSVYRWQGEVMQDDEVLLLIKTSPERLDAVRDWLLQRHPYELPEVLAISVSGGGQAYLQWIAQATGSEQRVL